MKFELLLISAVSIAILHSLAPDHYLPVVILSKARKIGIKGALLMSLVAGSLHVGSSAFLGIAIRKGFDVTGVARYLDGLSPVLLIAFGVVYAILSIAKDHTHKNSKSVVTLLLILGLSPCIPFIPVILTATTFSQALKIAVVFSAGTLTTILTLTYLSYKSIRPPRFTYGFEDVLAGIIISATGLIVFVIEKMLTHYKTYKERPICCMELAWAQDLQIY